ncbi:hypothetical protein [Neisseria chenwenguii]|uniref:hypothetical protein n=1 Tax=Neisseria chenwenguii TaxID=1853278 RepID=UPI000F4FBD34|nr:hypothetical protein [Neisseria chenwenguii]
MRHENTKTVRVRGGIHFSFERAEFRYKNEKYFLIDEHQLLNKMISADRNRQKSYEVTLENVCLEGYEKTASQNNGKTFGPLGQYEKAFVVKGVCYL